MSGTRTMPEMPLRDIAVKVAGAVATGIGVLGFVALVGGADYWLRFSSAGLPADETVADLSNSQLLVLGARELFPFLCVLVVEAIVLYTVENAAKGKLTFGLLSKLGPGEDLDTTRRILRHRVFLTVTAAVVAVAVHRALAVRATLPSLILITAVAGLLALIMLLYAATNSSFGKFLGVALAATVVFALVSSASRTSEAPDVRPVALVLDGKPLAGLYVGASTAEVYIAEVCARFAGSEVGDARTGTLIDVPRKDVSAILIGANASLEDAISRERFLLASLVNLGEAQGSLSAGAGPSASIGGTRRCTGPLALP